MDQGDGTADLIGTPALGTAATWHFTIFASNQDLSDAEIESFTLTVRELTITGILSGITNQDLSFTVTPVNFASLAGLSYQIDWGDGGPSSSGPATDLTAGPLIHDYANAGVYYPSATLLDQNNQAIAATNPHGLPVNIAAMSSDAIDGALANQFQITFTESSDDSFQSLVTALNGLPRTLGPGRMVGASLNRLLGGFPYKDKVIRVAAQP